MKILLVNPNRYRTPPVPPLALEYIQSALRESGHESRILDLCFSPDPRAALREEIARFRPGIAGVTVRNIDAVIFHNNEFFLEGIRDLTGVLKEEGIPVVLGGAGFSFSPREVLEYLGADWGITGPGEAALPLLLDRCAAGPLPRGAILNGWDHRPDPGRRVTGRGTEVDYPRYVAEGGLAGFETQKGCSGSCPYCAEAGCPVLQRDPGRVVEELDSLAALKITDFHLCDSEFNQDLGY
jgi:radical SAM superfamily enzyme YgiQ (UPF0313 family)